MDQIKNILLKSLRDTLDTGEQAQLNEWLAENPAHRQLLDELQDPAKIASSLSILNQLSPEKAWDKIRQHPVEEKAIISGRPSAFVYRMRWVAAAVLLLVASVSVWYIFRPQNELQEKVVYTGNVMPGRDGARLRLSNGSMLTIDSLADGLIARDGSIAIYKEKGQIVYKGIAGTAVQELVYNEIIADKGRKTSAVLPDGSFVWINAGSSVRYPLVFPGNERLITMKGEASFRAVHNTKQPFRVKVGDQVVEDIGTEFNINAYEDEAAIVTTMVEGAASVAASGNKVLLTAGQESQYTKGNIKTGKGNIEKAIAWRNNIFSFEHADLPTVLRQFARWYNIEVKYEGVVPSETFTGEMERELTLADALDHLKRMRVRFRIEEDKRLVVLP